MTRTTRTAPLLAAIISGALLASAGSASAAGDPGISSYSGAVEYLDPPPASVELGALESDDDLYLFAERKNVTLTEGVAADIMEPGVYFDDSTPDSERTEANMSTGTVPAGTVVDSYYLHFDNETYEFNFRNYLTCKGQIGVNGSITFDRPIVGVVLRSWKLNQSNDDVGLPDVEYDTHTYQHFPGVNITDGCKSDQMTLSADRRTLITRNFSDIHHDNFRVLVEAG